MNTQQKLPTLVTGAAGLVGRALVEKLVAMGRPVIALDRHSEMHSQGISIHACDLGDIHRLHALARNGIDAMVHCGAYSGPMVARDSPYSMVQVNIVGTANMLELARVQGARRFVYCSSTSAYGTVTGEGPAGEDLLLRPGSLYGASKVASEYIVAAYAQQYGLSGVSVRLSWVYGPKRTTDCVIRTMIEDALAERPTRMDFGLNFPRQFIHVDDAVRGLMAALDAGRLSQHAYNVTGDERHTLGDIRSLVKAVYPDADIELSDGNDPVDEFQAKFSIDAARRDLGYSPQVPLRDGIASYSKWLSKQRGATS